MARRSPAWIFSPRLNVAQPVENHLAGTLAPWKWGLTYDFMEEFNGVFSAVKSKAYCYRPTVWLFLRLRLLAGKPRLPNTWSYSKRREIVRKPTSI